MKIILRVSTNHYLAIDDCEQYYITPHKDRAYYWDEYSNIDNIRKFVYDKEWLQLEVGVIFDCFEFEEYT